MKKQLKDLFLIVMWIALGCLIFIPGIAIFIQLMVYLLWQTTSFVNDVVGVNVWELLNNR